METINESFDVSTSNASVQLKVEVTSKTIAIKWRYKNIFEKQFGFLPNKGGDTFVIQGTSLRVKWLRGGFNKVKSIVVTDLDDNILWMLNDDKANNIEVGVYTPWWAWIFILLCGLLFVLAGGGGIPALIGSVGALTCRSVSRNPDKSTTKKVMQCIGITSASWASTFAIVAILLSIFQPDISLPTMLNTPEPTSIPERVIQQIILTPNEALNVTDNLEHNGDEIVYEFEVIEGYYVFWKVIDYSSPDARYHIISSNGSEVTSLPTSMSSSRANTHILIDENGTFQIIVSNGARESINFEAEIWYIAPVFQTIELAPGDIYEFRGQIEFPGQIHFYQVELGENGGLYFERPNEEYTPLQYSFSHLDFDTSVPRRLANNDIKARVETYYVTFLSEFGNTGVYELDMWHVPYSDAIPVSAGVQDDDSSGIYHGVIEVPAQTLTYEFEVEDRPINITILSGSADLRWELREIDDTMTLADGILSSDQLIIESLSRVGIYQIELGDIRGRGIIGEFSLQFQYAE